ncbi:hypothetical protein OAL92_00745 [bacterium]|nr:hypothetical protein [bacterium]
MNSRYDCFANPLIRVFALLTVLSLVSFHGRQSGAAEPPGILSHQGHIAVDGVNFSGTGQFKFALVNGAGDISHWSNDSTSTSAPELLGLTVNLREAEGIWNKDS